MQKQNIKNTLALFVCRLGMVGLAPKAPGTWGSLWALLFAPLFFLPLPIMGRVFCLTAIFFVGALAATQAEKTLGSKDPSEVVVEELLGMWLAFLPFSQVSIALWIGGFVLFRFFDIMKPWPVKASENWMRSGYGIMIDDAIAGSMTMLCLSFLSWLKIV